MTRCWCSSAARAGATATPSSIAPTISSTSSVCTTGSASSDPQPHHILSTYYRAADVVVVPSRSESFGLVALEAAACGIPVVASAVGGLLSLVDDDVTGLLVEGRDPSDFAEAIDALLADPARLAAMGAAAHQRALGYTWAFTAGRLRRLYADLATRQLVTC